MKNTFCAQEKCRDFFGDSEIIVAEENHMKYVVNNIGRKLFAKYKIDGCLITDGERCDYMIVNCAEKKVYFIELKGKNIKKAISQIESSISILRPSLNGYQMNARIIATGVPKIMRTDLIKFKDKMKHHKGDVKTATNVLYEKL